MIDSPKVLRDYIAGEASVTALTSTRIYSEVSYPRPGYSPNDDGSCLVFRRRGGTVFYSAKLMLESYMFKHYAIDEDNANTLYRAVFDILHDHRGEGIASAKLEISGQTLTDMDTGWPHVLCFYNVMFRMI